MAEKLVEDIMNRNVITITKEKSILDLARLLIKNKISGVPVVDSDNTLRGIVSEADIVNFVKKDEMFFPMLVFPIYNYTYVNPDIYMEGIEKNKKALSEIKVEEIMHTWVKKVKKDDKENRVASIMTNNNVNRVPVVDDENKVIGIITRSDLVRSMVENDFKDQ
jgi:CBS domain-containing protein